MHIVAALKPNNKFQIKRYRLADGYGRPPGNDDGVHSLNSAYSARLKQESERLIGLIKKTSTLQSLTTVAPDANQEDWLFSGEYRLARWNECTTQACSLPDSITLPSLLNGKPTGRVEHLDYYEVVNRRLNTLDLLKKSQREAVKPRPWGLPVKPKEFRWQAGEKILEGGSIIDRFVGNQNSTMVTLTLPGSTWYAMDALARWSGWIVNRLTQVIRRIKTNGERPYWFFVWEHQKRGALHMHWCIGWNTLPQKRLALCYKMKDLWFDLLEEISVKENIDLFKTAGFGRSHRYNKKVWQWDIQDIKKSVAAYFAKYTAKNAEYGFKADRGRDQVNLGEKTSRRTRTTHPDRTYPSRYWGSSQTIKKWSKRLSQEYKWTVDSPEFADIVANRIRESFPPHAEFTFVSSIPFEVIEPVTGICIASGITESYVVAPELYPAFHSHVCNEIFERPYRMDAMDKDFLATGGFCPLPSLSNVIPHPRVKIKD